MTLDARVIEERLTKAMPGAAITIGDPRGDGEYLIIQVVAAAFKGLPLIEQHRLVYKALGETVLDPPPSLSLHTYIPEEIA